MEKLDKATEEICKDCEYGVIIQNCRECLFNIFRRLDKYPPFSGEEKDNGKIGDRNSDTRAK